MDAIPRHARPLRAALIGGLVLAAAALLVARSGWAHAFPDRSEPRVGATLSASPSEVRIWFDGELEPVFSLIRVENGEKQRVDRGDGRVSPQNSRLLEISVPPLPPGKYRVFWSVIARYGHRTEGDFPFRIK